MTVRETKILEALNMSMSTLAEEVHVHVALTREQFRQVRELCDERHSHLSGVPGEVAEARGAVRFARWLAPLAISLLSIAIGVLLALR